MITLHEAVPIGTKTGPVFVHGAIHQMCWDVYDDTDGQQVRAARRAAGIGLREAANRLGIRPSELSAIETGRCTVIEGVGAVIATLSTESNPPGGSR